MRNVLSALTLVMLAPTNALAVVDNYTECTTLMGFMVELEQANYAVPAGSAFTITQSHAPTSEHLAVQYVAYEDMLFRKVEIALESSEYSLPMVLVDSLYNFPSPQGANSVAVYDLTGRKINSSHDLARDGLQSVPLNCYPVSGLY
jgi:hypothetical protein